MNKHKPTRQQIEDALKVFIKSGSANGIEPMHKHLLKFIIEMSIAVYENQ